MVAPSGIVALIIPRVSKRDLIASSPPVGRGDALITAVGLLINSPEETIQSSAFFNTPGTPFAYSEVLMITLSAVFNSARNSSTSANASS